MKRIKVLIYVRVSTDKQTNNTSISKQIETLEEYCEAQGFEIVYIYEEEASAKNIDGREVFKKMYKHFINNEEIEYIIVFKLDRLFRNFLDSIFFWDQLKRKNKHFISITDNINTKEPNAKMMFLVNALKADMEREDIAFRTNFGMEKNAADGNFNGGEVYGYESVSKRLRIIPEEEAVIKYIFNKYVYEQWGYKKIANNLNLQGFKTKRENDWTINAVKTILENKIYIGFIKWRNKYTKCQHDSIISEELWNKAQELRAKKSYTPTKIHPGTFPLSGLLKCPQCGSSMVQGNSSEKYKYYQCNKNKNSGKKACSANLVLKENADEVVLVNLISYLDKLHLSPLLFSIIKSNLVSNLKSLTDEVNLLNRSLKSIRKKIKRAADLFLDNDKDSTRNNKSTFFYLIDEYEKEEADTLSRLNKLKKEINLQNNLNIKNNIEYVANHLKDFINIISEEEKKLLFHSIIKEVHVTNGPKPKDRLIKKVIFHFTEDEFNEYGLSLRQSSC